MMNKDFTWVPNYQHANNFIIRFEIDQIDGELKITVLPDEHFDHADGLERYEESLRSSD